MTPNSRSYISRFAQADTIVPGGVQGLDRYAYVSNNPLVYIDPSGHKEICGKQELFCGVRVLTPGQMIELNKDTSITEQPELIQEVEDYMKTHPNYDPAKDPYLTNKNESNSHDFVYLREEYWEDRLRDAGLCVLCQFESWDLIRYYDYHQQNMQSYKWDFSKTGGYIISDAVGIPLGLIGGGYFATRMGKAIISGIGIANSAASFSGSVADHDTLGTTLSIVSAAPVPVIPALAPSMALAKDVSSSYVPYDYVPSIPR